jgi:hypothetical protein
MIGNVLEHLLDKSEIFLTEYGAVDGRAFASFIHFMFMTAW